MKIPIEAEFDFKEEIYLKTAVGTEDEQKGMVLSYEVYPGNRVLYDVRWADNSRGIYYAFELTSSKFVKNEEEEYNG